MQYQVPKFIEVEDKVFFGVLTFRQMAYVGAAFLLSSTVYSLLPFGFFMIFSLLFFALAGAFAFVRINGVPFSRTLRSALKFFWQPQVYVWKPKGKMLEEAESAAGKSPQEQFSELKAKLKDKLRLVAGPKGMKRGGAKILVDQPLIRGFEEKVRQSQ